MARPTGCAIVPADRPPEPSAWAAPASRCARYDWPDGAMLYDPVRHVALTAAVLLPETYGARAQRVAEGGRQAAWFVSGEFGDGVLRHYQRGGLIARISRDRYIWQGESRTRCFAEYRVMSALHARGLSVPAPLAAGYWRDGLTYRAALLTQRIPDVRSLAARLGDAPVAAIGRAIADMHRAGAWHADLNAYNILIDANDRVWLIDFDRSTLGGISDRQRHANLERLARSLRKVGADQGVALAQQLEREYRAAWGA